MLGSLHQFLSEIQPVSLHRRGAGIGPKGLQEGYAHSAADEDVIQLVQQVFQYQDLVADLGPAQQRCQWTLRRLQGPAHGFYFSLHQQSHGRWKQFRQTHGRGMSAVSNGECVHDEAIGERGQVPAELRVVFLFAGVEAEVFQQNDVARSHVRDGGGHSRAGAIVKALNRPVQQKAQPVSHGGQPQLLRNFTAGPSQVGAKYHPAVSFQQIMDGGQGGPQALVVGGDGFDALLDGYVEVDADQHPLAGHIQTGQAAFSHGRCLPTPSLSDHATALILQQLDRFRSTLLRQARGLWIRRTGEPRLGRGCRSLG